MDTPFPTLSADFLNASPQPSAAAVPAAPEVLPASTELPIASEAAAPEPDAAISPAIESELSMGLRDALATALELAPQMIDNLIGRALLGMDRQATAHPDTAQKALLDSSAVALDAYRRRWIQQFPPLLRIAFAHPPAPDAALPMADLRVCAEENAQLEALVLEAGSQRGNPLGAPSYIRAVNELISRSQAHPDQRQAWTHFLMGALGTQLAWVYLQLAACLRSPGERDLARSQQDAQFVHYAEHVFGLGGEAPPDLPAVGTPESMMTPQMRALAEEARQTVKKLRAVLGMPPNEEAQFGDEMARMMQDIEESERLMIEVNKRGLDPDAPVVDQTHLRVERLLNDYRNATTPSLQRLPQPVRATLERLQMPLEQLAALDANLLTQGDHPVRQFLEAVSKRGLLFASETTDGFDSYLGPVEKMITAIIQITPPSAKLFSEALVRLQPVWKVQDEELKRLAEEKERSLARLEVRKQLASRLAFELVSRRDASDAPVPVKQFLMGPWAQVLARAQLHPQHPQDEQRYEYIAALLLWSVSMRRAGSCKEELVRLAPALTQALRAGLASVQHAPADTDAFLTELTKLHEAVLTLDYVDDSDDIYPPEPPESDLSGMMMLGSSQEAPRPPPPAPSAPSYQSDLNLL